MLAMNLRVILSVFLRKLTAFIGVQNAYIQQNNASRFDAACIRVRQPESDNHGKRTCN
jgi:hypothetical protein